VNTAKFAAKPETISKTIYSIDSISKNISAANNGITDVNSSLTSIDKKVPAIPDSLIDNTENIVIKMDCFESEISKLLAKRFLFLRFIFANPGKSFKECAKKFASKDLRKNKIMLGHFQVIQ